MWVVYLYQLLPSRILCAWDPWLNMFPCFTIMSHCMTVDLIKKWTHQEYSFGVLCRGPLQNDSGRHLSEGKLVHNSHLLAVGKHVTLATKMTDFHLWSQEFFKMIKMYCKWLKHGQNQLDLTGIRNVFMRQLISLLQNETINIKNNIEPPLLNLTY